MSKNKKQYRRENLGFWKMSGFAIRHFFYDQALFLAVDQCAYKNPVFHLNRAVSMLWPAHTLSPYEGIYLFGSVIYDLDGRKKEIVKKIKKK